MFKKEVEGYIIYDVTFPYELSNPLVELYPKEMKLEFKNEMMHSILKSSYGVISTEFIIDHEGHHFTQLLKSFGDKYAMSLDEKGTEEWLNQYPKVRLEPTNEMDSIAGYACQKTIAYFIIDSVPAIELYTTKDIQLDQSNWWNQFSGVDGFLMGYEFEQYGKRMKLRAREVVFEPIDEIIFQVPSDYKPVDLHGMQNQIEVLITQFMK